MNYNDNILPYLKKQLSSDDKVVFENYLSNNLDFGSKVQEERRILEQIELKRLRNKFATMHEEEKNNAVEQVATPTARILTMPTRQRFAPYAMAASVVGVLFFSYLIFYKKQTNDIAPIANTNSNSNNEVPNNTKQHQTTPNSNNNRPNGSNTQILNKSNTQQSSNNQILKETNTQQNYDLAFQDEVKSISGELMSASNENSLDAAKSFLKKNKIEEAIAALNQLLKNNSTDEDAEWFLAVAQLKTNKNAAFTLLQGIAQKDGKYQDKAEIMLRRLQQ